MTTNPLVMFWVWVVQADFAQVLGLYAGLFLIPLEHRPHWRQTWLGCVALTFLFGGVMTSLFRNDLIDLPLVRVPLEILYYMGPLVLAYAIIRLCSSISREDALYGTACVYAMQHISFCLTIALLGETEALDDLTLLRYVASWGIVILVGIAGYLCIARHLPLDGHYGVSRRKAIVISVIVFSIAMLLNYPIRQVTERNPFLYSVCMIYDLLTCAFILYSQTEQRRETDLVASLRTEQRLRQQMQEQYELSRDNIEQINRKCHNLKHQLAALRFASSGEEREASLQEIERAVMIYDSVAKTGNEVLDTVLTQMSLTCEENQISWTCMADGAALNHIAPVDLYTLFGNALDNAIESSCRIADPDKRNVSVTVQRQHGAAFIQIENYYEGTLQMEDGLPVTTKEDTFNHGYGVRSIRDITSRYGGTMDIAAEDELFVLSILLPLSEARSA